MTGTIQRSRITIGATIFVAVVVGASIVVVLLPDEKPQIGIAGRASGPNESPLAGGEKVSRGRDRGVHGADLPPGPAPCVR